MDPLDNKVINIRFDYQKGGFDWWNNMSVRTYVRRDYQKEGCVSREN